MYRAAKEIVFRASHYLRFGQDGQEEPHEHDWRIRAVVESSELPPDGMVMDFEELGRRLRQIAEPLRQAQMLNKHVAFENHNPSAEHLARYIYEQLEKFIPETAKLQEVVVWEQEDCQASYRPPE